MSRKDYTVQELQKGLANLGFPDAQVNELVVRSPRGMGWRHHYTADVGWGAMANPPSSAGPPKPQPQLLSTAGRQQRPSSAPAGGRGTEQSVVPNDLHQMGLKLSEAERALSEVRAGLAGHMAASSGGRAQPSSLRTPEQQPGQNRPASANMVAPGRIRPSSAPGSRNARPHPARPQEQGAPQSCSSSGAGTQLRTVAPGRMRPSSAPGSQYGGAQEEARANHAFNNSSRVFMGPAPQRSKPKRPTSAPGHSAARAQARGQGRRRSRPADRSKPIEKFTNVVMQGASGQTGLSRSQSWASPTQVPLSSSLNLTGKEFCAVRGLAPCPAVSGQDFSHHSSARRPRRPNSKGKQRSSSKGTHRSSSKAADNSIGQMTPTA